MDMESENNETRNARIMDHFRSSLPQIENAAAESPEAVSRTVFENTREMVRADLERMGRRFDSSVCLAQASIAYTVADLWLEEVATAPAAPGMEKSREFLEAMKQHVDTYVRNEAAGNSPTSDECLAMAMSARLEARRWEEEALRRAVRERAAAH
jgi:hypothetical protein